MEWEVWVEKDMLRRRLKVWVESNGEKADERLNWYYKDGELMNEVRKIQYVMPEGLIPMFAGPMDMMKHVIEKMAEAYPSRLFVKRDEYDQTVQEYRNIVHYKDAEIKKWEGRFDRTLNAALDNRQPIMATLESTEDELPVLQPNALVDSWPFGWRDVIGYLFAGVFYGGICFAIGRAFRWW